MTQSTRSINSGCQAQDFCSLRLAARSARGFTLIELLIAVVIVSVLASVANASYSDYITAANRSEARSALTVAAGTLEKCKALYAVYNHANCGLDLPFTTENDYYTVTGEIAATRYTLAATAAEGKRQADDEKCVTLTLNHMGATGAKGSSEGADTSSCW